MKGKFFKYIIVFVLAAMFMLSNLMGCKVTPTPPEPKPDVITPPDEGIDYQKPLGAVIKDGSSDYSIVYPEDASEAVYYAATELQHFLEQVTGVILPVISDTNAESGQDSRNISIGNTSLLKQSGIKFDYSTLNGDGFFIKTVDKSIFINGFRDRGVIYGAYDYLEVMTGLRFVTYDYTYIPKLDEISLYKTDRIQVPAFEYRGVISNMTFQHVTEEDFTVRMRFNYMYAYISEERGGRIGVYNPESMNGVHNTLWWVDPGSPDDPNSLCRLHPEIFVWGKEGIPIEMCWSLGITDDGKFDPSIEVSPIKILLEKLRQELRNIPEYIDTIMIGQMDGPLDGSNIYCQCERCLADETKYTRSGMMMRFINIAAEEAAKIGREELGREIYVCTLAYGRTRSAPLKDGKLAHISCKPLSNVYVQVAPYFGDFYLPYVHERQDPELQDIFEGWKKVHDKFYLWAYTVANHAQKNNGLFYFDSS